MLFAIVLRDMNKKEWKKIHKLVYNHCHEYIGR